VKTAEGFEDEALFERGEDRFDGGGFGKSSRLPVCEIEFAEGAGAALAGDRHEDHVLLRLVVTAAADHYGQLSNFTRLWPSAAVS